ncbi:MAG TPA: histidine phosphatase family protein [Beijerinckiaceae bacterium]|nr:histidine phosphatase family protein [Beijerinckiaceae bacterium]
MRRLMLLRHGKSDSPSGVSDIDRPLARRGKEAVPRIATHMAEEQLFPDLALVSPARRARESWDLLAPKLGEVPARSEPRIYEAPPERLLAVIRELGPGVRSVLLVGHNPGLEDLAKLLIRHGDRYAFARIGRKYPTAGLAVIDLAIEGWRELKPGSGRLDRFVTPKSLGQDEDD